MLGRRLSSFVHRPEVLILIGLNGLLLWLLYPTIASIVYNNIGSVQMNRALLSPNLEPEQRWDQAVEAGQSFQNALAWDNLNGLAYYNLGGLYGFFGDSDSAFRAWARSAALNPGDPSSRFAFGQALAAHGQEVRARREWGEAGAALYLVNQGLALARLGDQLGALEQYQHALAIDQNLVEGHYYSGRASMALGRQDEALAALESAAALEPPSSPRRYLFQAEVYTARQEWTRALLAFKQAADLTPQDPVPYYRMGWVLDQKLGDQEAAIAQYEWALRLAPDYIQPRLDLSRLYVDQGECDRAAQWLNPLLSSEAGTKLAGQLHNLLANCFLQESQASKALPHLEEVLSLDPQSVAAHLALAQAYVQMQRYREAIETYRQVLQLQPGQPQAQQALEELGWSEPSPDEP